MATTAIPTNPQLADLRLKDLLTADLGLADVFYRHGLDFCCHGHQTLAQAAGGAGVAVQDVLADMERHRLLGSRRLLGVEQWPVAFLAEYIERVHHVATRALIADITPALARIVQKHAPAHPELHTVAELFAALVAELEPHLLKEERVLFPYLCGRPSPLPTGAMPGPIEVMTDEHDEAGALLYRLAEVTNQFVAPENACQTTRFVYRKLRELDEDLRLHIHLENNLLFPKALAAEAARLEPAPVSKPDPATA